MAIVTMKALLETGVHFGHRTRKWNPRMKSYIFTERNGIHIIDLQKTLNALDEVYALVRDRIVEGGRILFVGTKRQAQETIELEAKRCNMPYVNARWLGGTLTNWRTIRSRIDELEELERQRDAGEFERLTKKEGLSLMRRIDKLEGRLGGIRNMLGLPDLLFVVDVRREETAIHEANLLDIPVIALVDTNCDPTNIDYIIPSNDDAIRAIKLMTSKIADSVLEGLALRKDEEEIEAVPLELEAVAELEMTDEELLGEATLAKLQSGAFDDDRSEEEAEPGEEEPSEELAPEGEELEAQEPVAESEEDVEPEGEELEAQEPVAESEEDVEPEGEELEAQEPVAESEEDIEPEGEEREAKDEPEGDIEEQVEPVAEVDEPEVEEA
jgi:small subunit ribosomal protein S2